MLHELRNAGSLQKLKKERKWTPPPATTTTEYPRRNAALFSSWFYTSDYRNCKRTKLSCFKSFIVVQLLSGARLLATPRTAAGQAPWSATISQSLETFTFTEWVRLSYHLILCRSLLFLPSVFHSIRDFFASGVQSTGASALASVLLMDIQSWFPLGWTGWISLQS